MPTMPTPRIYSYVRFSSEPQLRGDSLRRQNELIDKYAKEKNLTLDDELRFEDRGISAFRGENLAKGALGQFVESVREGRIAAGSVLLVESLDRITRLKVREAMQLFLELVNSGITIVTLADGKEHSGSALDQNTSPLFESLIVLGRAHDESQMKSGRLKAAWAEKRKNLKLTPYTGRIPSWLVRKDDRVTFRVIPEKAKLVKRIFGLCLKGEHSESIARLFHSEKLPTIGKGRFWTHSYVAQALRNPAVTGRFTPHKMDGLKRIEAGPTVDDYYPRIVTDRDFFRVQEIMDARSKHRGGRVSADGGNLFRKVLHCGYCGAPVYRTAKGQLYGGKLRRVLICRNAKDGTGCFYAAWQYDEFESSFLKMATELKVALAKKVGAKSWNDELDTLRGERKMKDQQLGNLVKAIEGGEQATPKTLFVRIKNLEDEIVAIDVKIEETQRKLSLENDGPSQLAELKIAVSRLSEPAVRKKAADLISRMFERIDLFFVGPHFQFAKYKAAHARLVRTRGKNDGWVAVKMREGFDRRKHRFFDAVLQMPGVKHRLHFSDSTATVKTQRLDLVDDEPDDKGATGSVSRKSLLAEIKKRGRAFFI